MGGWQDVTRLAVQTAKDEWKFGHPEEMLMRQDRAYPWDWLERSYRFEITEVIRVGELSTAWNPLRDGQVDHLAGMGDECHIGTSILPEVRGRGAGGFDDDGHGIRTNQGRQ